MFKNLTVGKKIGLGFGVVLVALSVVVALSFTGVSSIVRNAEEVIYGNLLDSEMAPEGGRPPQLDQRHQHATDR